MAASIRFLSFFIEAIAARHNKIATASAHALVLVSVLSDRNEDRRLAGVVLRPHGYFHEQLRAAIEPRGIREATHNENDVHPARKMGKH